MKTELVELDVDHVGSQDPALQPTTEDFARLSEYFRASPERRAALLAEAQVKYPTPAINGELAAQT